MALSWTKRATTGVLMASVVVIGACGSDDDAPVTAGRQPTTTADGLAPSGPSDPQAFCDAAQGLERLEVEIGDDRSQPALDRFVAEFPPLIRTYASNPPEELAPQVQTVVRSTLMAILGNEAATQSEEFAAAGAAIDAHVAANCAAPAA